MFVYAVRRVGAGTKVVVRRCESFVKRSVTDDGSISDTPQVGARNRDRKYIRPFERNESRRGRSPNDRNGRARYVLREIIYRSGSIGSRTRPGIFVETFSSAVIADSRALVTDRSYFHVLPRVRRLYISGSRTHKRHRVSVYRHARVYSSYLRTAGCARHYRRYLMAELNPSTKSSI